MIFHSFSNVEEVLTYQDKINQNTGRVFIVSWDGNYILSNEYLLCWICEINCQQTPIGKINCVPFLRRIF